MSVFHSSFENNDLHAYLPGDIMIGGLFPIHLQTNRTISPGPVSCENQVMIYTIQEINQHTPRLLPNLTLGYNIYDTCGDVSLAIRAALQLLKNQSDPQRCLIPASINSSLPEPETKVVIGERFSEMSIAVARILALSSVTQISYASTSEQLSIKYKFPTFLRTVSSDKHQTKAIYELVKNFSWQSVAIVGSTDEYGKYGTDSLKQLFHENNVCVDFVEILPDTFNKNCSTARNLIEKINSSKAEVIIVFTKEANVRIILEGVIEKHFNRTWIASDTWSISGISEITGIESIGPVFGFIYRQKKVPGFQDYVTSMFNGTTNGILSYYQAFTNNSKDDMKCNCENKTSNLTCLYCYTDQDESYNIYLAVHVIAEGLRSLLNCSNQSSTSCKSCEKYQYSPKANRSTCENKAEEFLEWSDPFSIILTTVAGFAIIVTVVIATIIGINCGTPIVKAIGGCLCFVEVASLLLSFCITFTFIGRPTENSCLGIPLFGISFSFCISCILANLIQILVGFSFDPRVGSKIKRLNHPVAVVIIISGVQIGISLAWLIVLPHSPVEESKTTTILYHCDMSEPSKKFFAATVVYNSFWGLVCFIFAFKGRQLPDIYKNASLITVSMVLFLIIWIVFLPIFLTLKGKYKPAISSAAILISCLSILGCHLAPKCYIMLFRKEINNQNAISEYIRKHYERKNLPVIS
ncbi:G-protein coupled receptor family C group 6 member A-like [Anableps anableps]